MQSHGDKICQLQCLILNTFILILKMFVEDSEVNFAYQIWSEYQIRGKGYMQGIEREFRGQIRGFMSSM